MTHDTSHNPENLARPLRQPAPEEDNAHDLFPEWLRAQVPDLGAARYARDPTLRCKYLTPDSNWRWYVIEAGRCEDTAGNPDVLFWGFVEGIEHEFGYFSLNELASVRGPLGLPVERDLYFEPKPTSQIAR